MFDQYFGDVTERVTRGRPVNGVYLHKAFDKLPHWRLVHKLIPHGIGRNVRVD